MARRCLLEPIDEIFQAASLLKQAASAHVAGDRALAVDLIVRADLPAIAVWTESIWGRRDPKIHRFRALPHSPPRLLSAERPRPRMPPRAIRLSILSRDGFHCRFCGIPVVAPEIRARIRATYPDALRWGPANRQQHAAFQCMWLQYDHVLPNERGGESSIDNIVVTCAPCNFGRMQWTIEEADLIDPREREARASWSGADEWDGLQSFTR